MTHPLTPRQRQVAELIAEGLRSREIGERLFISSQTVDRHVEDIAHKLGIVGNVRLKIAAYILVGTMPQLSE